MRKTSKFITLFSATVILFSPCTLAKKSKHKPPTFFKSVMRIGEKYENPALKEKLSQIKKSKSYSENSDTVDVFKKYDLPDNERKLSESCFAWLAIIFMCLIIVKIILTNFKIPFDYDPNFKSKHISHRKVKNKKYNFQKR